jgi:uncharacterized YigZ family protein
MLFEDTYKTIEKSAEGVYKDRGSKFIALAFPVNTEEEVKKIQAELRKKYHDARHHCFAYLLGFDKSAYRMNDDGEPSGTAGRPIFGQIQSNDLTNILIVVVRYFGGTLLGVRGLIDAYKGAAADALKNARIINKTVNEVYEITFDYSAMNTVIKILKDNEAETLSSKYELDGNVVFRIRKNQSDKICKQLKQIENLSLKYTRTE